MSSRAHVVGCALRALGLGLALGLAAGACRGRDDARLVVVTVVARPESQLDPHEATWEPPGAVRRAVRTAPGRTDLELDADALPPALAIRVPGACPLEASLAGAAVGERRVVELDPWIDLGEARPQIGFDAGFEVAVAPGCREAVAGSITWRQLDGAPLAELRPLQNGFRLHARTPALAASPSGGLPWGIVPVSQATRGAFTLEATWRGVGPEVRRVLHGAAAARASGVPSLAPGQRVLLGGGRFHVAERPVGGHAEVSASDERQTFLPDASGRWVLEDERGRALSLRAGRHDAAPLDCGRADCHASAAAGAAHTRMTAVLAAGLLGSFGEGYDPSCAIACHAVGEPGLADGGFAHVARELDRSLPSPGPGAWEALGRPLRRLGGVGCTACHGLGAIPEPAARWTILRTSVCAVCHDAPPRYGHVAAWQTTRMSRADAAPRARAEAACAACHTTAGFLDALGVRPAAASRGGPDEPHGIGCAACHAAHAATAERALVRRVAPPGSLATAGDLGASGVCLPCHAPRDGEPLPSASAATLWLGRQAPGGQADPAPHAEVPGGCVGCHAAGAEGVAPGRGAGHAFRVDRTRCAGCHACPSEERLGADGSSLQDRAARLWSRLATAEAVSPGGDGAPHPSARVLAAPGSAPARAAWLVALVLEDPAAGAHNAPYARQVLDEAEALLTAP
ncbi:MAG: hypothetical protein HY908_31280 [Myxococcales bacterium]|nr:hypothetical protein [Myxococcales bacterium]